MLDGVTAYNELRAAERAGVRGTALWRLGTEDPSLWSIWDVDASGRRVARAPGGDASRLRLDSRRQTETSGASPRRRRRASGRFASTRRADTIVDESYVSLPFSYRIDQLGGGAEEDCLSFDDGPDPQNTPQILDILKAEARPGHVFRHRQRRQPIAGLAEARIRRRPRDRQSHLHASARGRDFARADRAGAEPDGAALRQHAGREDAAVPPALRH